MRLKGQMISKSQGNAKNVGCLEKKYLRGGTQTSNEKKTHSLWKKNSKGLQTFTLKLQFVTMEINMLEVQDKAFLAASLNRN